ncbi:hypothetical protein [Microcystis aeruginosa]|uniref:hypothetical protein n=1 Tax=Microcystis aeruginosa TaxID=1126 RepID=UPI00123096B3|nr:hypothetical protein [Microcystis aeruginosa]
MKVYCNTVTRNLLWSAFQLSVISDQLSAYEGKRQKAKGRIWQFSRLRSFHTVLTSNLDSQQPSTSDQESQSI